MIAWWWIIPAIFAGALMGVVFHALAAVNRGDDD